MAVPRNPRLHVRCPGGCAERRDRRGVSLAHTVAMSKIAFLVDQMFEDAEFRVPYDRLRAAGHQIDILGIKAGDTVNGYRQKEQVKIEKPVAQAKDEDYDALVIPGGY